MMSSKLVLWLVFLSMMPAVLLSAGCPSDPERTCAITNPRNGAVVTHADDVSEAVSGVQINVVVALSGFSDGQDVSLTVNGGATHRADRRYDGSGQVVFNDTNLAPGENAIVATAGSSRSTVSVTLEGDACPTIGFVVPEAFARLSTTADADGDPSNGFQYDVRVSVAGATDGTSVELRVGGVSAATAVVSGGAAAFEDVTLADAYPDVSTSVRLRAQTSATCTADIGIQIVRDDVPCPNFTFTSPLDGWTLGTADDVDGNPANGFQYDVVVSTNAAAGTSIELLVNGSRVAATTVTGPVARFAAVDLPVGGVDLRVQRDAECGASVSVTVDTGAPSCDIRVPLGGWLNKGQDVNASTPGLEIDFEVTSNAGAGQPVTLIIDGRPDGAPVANLASGLARFAAIALADGSHTVRARCRNAVGNIGWSATPSYDVDTVVPTCGITAPADGTWFNDGDDGLAAVDGTQVQVSITATDSPSRATVSRCGSDPLDPEGIVTLTGGAGSGYVTLTGAGNAICCNARDPAGNAGESRITLNLETENPQFEIRRPAPATTLILAVDDEGPSDSLCQYTVTVGCSNMGQPVTLTVNGGPKPPETCTASADPLGGTATWTSTVLPQGSVTLRAEGATISGLTGVSPEKTVTVDTAPPALTVTLPICGASFTPADDVDVATPGIQLRVQVRSDTSPTTLEVTDGGGAPVSSYERTFTPPNVIVFTAVTVVPAGSTVGTASLRARATDAHGQEGFSTPSPCTIQVRDLPQVTITSPTAGALLSAANDCNPVTPAFDLGVTVSTNIPAGTGSVELFVAGTSKGTLPYGGSPVTFCVPAADGTNILVRAVGTDPRGPESAEIRVTIDSLPPDTPITDLDVTVANRRGGEINLAWTAPADAGGGSVSGYRIRCTTSATSPVAFAWATATPYSFTGVAGAPGTAQSQRLVGFRIERYVACMVRPTDAVGSLGPEGNTDEVQLAFLQQEIVGPDMATPPQMGFDIEPCGDVNGDGREDFVVGSLAGNAAYVFFGRPLGPPETPPTTWGTVITGAAGSLFGYSVAGIGDFNGDTIGDLAIGATAVNANRGAAYLFYGRSPAWPSEMTIAEADVTIVMADPGPTSDLNSFLGTDVAPAGDYDGDGRKDLLVGAPGWNGTLGASLLLFGRSIASGTTINVPGDRASGFAGDHWFVGTVAGGRIGSALSPGYRLNGDAYDDVIIGAPRSADGGRVFVSFGRTRSATTGLREVSVFDRDFVSPTTGTAIRFGNKVAVADVDGDGDLDLLVYLTNYPGATGSYGGVLLYSNDGLGAFPSTAAADFQNNLTDNANDFFGLSMAAGAFMGSTAFARLDGDTVPELLFGSLQAGLVGGTGYLFFGAPRTGTTFLTSADRVFGPPTGDTTSRAVVSYVGDVNGDGRNDFAVGQTQASGGRGRIVVVY